MEANVLGDDEECAVCLESLELKKCSRYVFELIPWYVESGDTPAEQANSLPCQHVFCNNCLQNIRPDARSYHDDVESIPCPTCRTPCPRDEMETVELTSTQQWDALLDVARRWAKIDMRRQEDTSEEEGEEEFIDDAETNNARLESPMLSAHACAHRDPSARLSRNMSRAILWRLLPSPRIERKSRQLLRAYGGASLIPL